MSFKVYLRYGYPHEFVTQNHPENSLAGKSVALLESLRKTAFDFADPERGDIARINRDTTLTPKGKAEKISEFGRMRVAEMQTTLEMTSLITLIENDRVRLEAEYENIFAIGKDETAADFLREKEIRDALFAFTDPPKGSIEAEKKITAESKRMAAIQTMIDTDDEQGMNAVFRAPKMTPILRYDDTMEEFRMQWAAKKNPALAPALKSARNLEGDMAEAVETMTVGLAAAAGLAPTMRQRLEAASA